MKLALTDRLVALLADESDAARAEFHLWRNIHAIVEKSPSRRKLEAMAEIAGARGWNIKKIQNRLTKIRKARDPEQILDACINRAIHKKPTSHLLPYETRMWIGSEYLRWQRQHGAARRVHESLVSRWQRWRAGEKDAAIPGYARPPKSDPKNGNLPAGWSYSNICKLAPDDFIRTLSSHGPRAASSHKAKVRHTRCDEDGNILPFGSILYYDDNWHDLECNFIGHTRKPVRPVSFNVMEGLSTYRQLSIKPRMLDENTGHHKNLNETDAFWFWVMTMQEWGYNPIDGTTCIVEGGTMNPRVDNDVLHELTRGKIQFSSSKSYGAPAVAALFYKCEGGGNFRFKAPLEGSFNLDHNLRAALPGQLGRNPANSPEEKLGWRRYNTEILSLIDDLSPEVFAQLRLPLLNFPVYKRFAHQINDRINKRTDHQIEGWGRCGFQGMRWRLSTATTDWADHHAWLKLTPAQQDALRPIILQPGHSEAVNLSPHDVFTARVHTLKKLDDHIIPQIAPRKHWLPVAVGPDGEISVRDSEIDADPLRFRRDVFNAHGDKVILERGARYLRLLNPFDPSRMWIARADGSYIGTSHRILPGLPNDPDARVEQYKRIEVSHATDIREFEILTAEEGSRRESARQHNARILSDPRTPEQKATAQDATRALRQTTTEPLESYAIPAPPEDLDNIEDYA